MGAAVSKEDHAVFLNMTGPMSISVKKVQL